MDFAKATRRAKPLRARLPQTTTIRDRPRSRGGQALLDSVIELKLGPADLSPDQRSVYDETLRWYGKGESKTPLLTIGGFAGTGKTTVISVLAKALTKRASGIAFCAFTGKAAGRLRSKLHMAGIDASRDETTRNYVGTIHSLIYEPSSDGRGGVSAWKKRDDVSGRYALIIVDEASMISEEIIKDLLSYEIPVLAVGDHGQLAPVGGEGSLMESPDLRLEQVHRHALDNPILALSLYVREHGDLPAHIQPSPQVTCLRGDEVTAVYERLYDSASSADDALDVVSLTYTNAMRKSVNAYARSVAHGRDMTDSPLVKGDQVICLKNQLSMYNGMRGHIESDVHSQAIWYKATGYFPDDELEASGYFLQAQFGRDRTFSNFDELNDELRPYVIEEWRDAGLIFDYGYALTVHKSQGSQFRDTFLFYQRPFGLTADDFRRWLYTAITRATDHLYVVSG